MVWNSLAIVDVFSLMSFGDVMVADEVAAVECCLAHKKVGDKSVVTNYMALFSLEIPTIFGKGKDAATLGSSKLLPGVLMF